MTKYFSNPSYPLLNSFNENYFTFYSNSLNEPKLDEIKDYSSAQELFDDCFLKENKESNNSQNKQ